MDYKLSIGAVQTLMQGGEVDKPVFQILGFKKIGGQAGNDRFRLNISDGVHTHTFAMLATQLNPMISSGELDNLCIIRAEKMVSNSVSPEKKVLIILELTVIAKGSTVGVKIGNPIAFNEKAPGGEQPMNGNAKSSVNVKTEPTKTASAFYGSKGTAAPSPAAPSPVRQNANMSMSISEGNCVPIRDINPYNNKCTIKARVTNKGTVRTWSNARGEGKLFSIDLLDDSGEIRMTGFNQAVDTYYEMIKVNEVYLFSKFQVKTANKQFTSLNHDYELSFTNDTQVMPCMDSDTGDIPTMQFAFTEIAFIETCEKDKIVDVIGVCKNKGELATITTKKDNKELKKREIILVDRTNTEVPLTLWGKQAEDFEDDSNPVIAIKGAKVGDFNGKNLSVMNSSTFLINPDIQEAHILRGWYDNEGHSLEAKSLVGPRGAGGASGNAPWKFLREANADGTQAAEAGFYFKSRVMVMAIKRDNAMYKACAEEKCNKKIVDQGNGMYRCEKCNKELPDYKWRVLMNACFADISDSIWATCFQDQGEYLLGDTAAVLGPMFEENPNEFDQKIKQAVFQNLTVKFRGKMETYNNEQRIKYTVMDLQPVNFAEYARELVNQIKETIA